MPRKEVITLQIGSYSNFAASHLWNLQSNCFYYTKDAPYGHEFDHDVFYREGRNLRNKVTFTPRTVLIDLKGSLGSCALPIDDSYDGVVDEEARYWDGKVQVHKTENAASPSKSEECGETDAIPSEAAINKRTFAGYLQRKLHPKSVLISKQFDAGNPQQPFDAYNQGESLWSHEGDEFEERVRWFAEDCDYLSGFNIIADIPTGFSGFTAKCLDMLSDDFHGKAVAAWGLFDCPKDEKSTPYRSLNTMLVYSKLQENCDVILPLSATVDGIGRSLRRTEQYPLDNSPFTSSGLLATHMDTIMSSLKLKENDNSLDFGAFCAAQGSNNRKFVVSSLVTSPTKSSILQSITPKCAPKQSTLSYVVSRACEPLKDSIARIAKTENSTASYTSLRHPIRFSEMHFNRLPDVEYKASFGNASGICVVQNSTDIVEHLRDVLRRRPNYGKLHKSTSAKEEVDSAFEVLKTVEGSYLGTQSLEHDDV